MRITFNNIRLNNFMSFGDEFVQLDNLGYVLVAGKNECPDDASLSNGSGKNSIWEGIVCKCCRHKFLIKIDNYTVKAPEK